LAKKLQPDPELIGIFWDVDWLAHSVSEHKISM